MSPLDILQLVGYSIGAILPLWMGAQLVFRRHSLSSLERLLFALALTMGGWQGASFHYPPGSSVSILISGARS